MIKKLHLLLPAAVLLMCGGMASLTSCTYDIDNPAPVVDDKSFDRDKYVDASVRPGDDFYRYAVGRWLYDETLPDLIERASSAMDNFRLQLITQTNDPIVSAVRQKMAETAADGTADKQFLQSRLDYLSTITTQAELEAAFTQLHQWGYKPLVNMVCFTNSGVISPVIISEQPSADFLHYMDMQDPEALAAPVELYCGMLAKVGFSPERIVEINQHALSVEILEMAAYDINTYLSASYKELPRQLRLAHSAATRSTDNTNRQKVYELMGIDDLADQMIVNLDTECDLALDSLIDLLLAGTPESIATMRDYLIFYVFAQDALFLPQFFRGLSISQLSGFALDNARYYMNRLLVDAYGPQNIYKEKASEMMEELRQVLIEHIDKLDWMTDATKQEAKKKARAMKFCIGYPDQWSDEFTPRIEGTTLLETISSLRRQSTEFFRKIAGRDMLTHGWDFWANNSPFSKVIGLYEFNCNQLLIMPGFLAPPLFDTGQSEAALYATAYVFAHEMCHGFDALGANCDERGAERNWWTADDRAAFEKKQQQLIALWGQLEAYPGQPADGKQTLQENMADLGGLTLALGAYKRRLEKLGYSGQQFDEQLRKFWLSYAYYYTDSFERDVNMLTWRHQFDTHSAAHNRVNGIARLFDYWYRLFDVKPTDKLYLAPEDRVRIW